MSSERVFRPLTRGARTGGSGRLMLALFVGAAVTAVVARTADRSWWITPALIAVVVGVTAPIAFWVAWHEGIGRTLTVTRETITMTKVGRRGERTVVVRRDAPAYGAAFAAVRRGPDTPGTDRTLLVTDGEHSIRMVEASWGPQTLRDIAAALGVPSAVESMSRADLVAAVGGRAAVWERRPGLIAVVVAVGVVVIVLVGATVTALLAGR
jgi:hypothetical protein